MWFKKNILWISLVFDLIFFDLFTKWLAKNFLLQPVNILPGFLSLSVSFNTGIAFSIPIPNTIMIILSPLLTGLLLFLIARSCNMNHPIAKTSIVLLISGASGNIINRLWTDSVIDFIAFDFWPNFNLADSYLTIAAFLLIIFYGKIARAKYGRPN